MTPRALVVDTNVVVAGFLTSDPDSPTAWVLGEMLAGRLPFLLSADLLAEYRQVLLRPAVRERHRLEPAEVDRVLVELTANAVVREPGRATDLAPDRRDQHLWDLVACEDGSVLVTGDHELLRASSDRLTVMTPVSFKEAAER